MEIRLPKYTQKVWGHEEIIVDNTKYCGKKLYLKERYRSSIHKHPKTETFYIESGRVYLELENPKEELDGKIIYPHDIVDIESNKWHRFSGLENSIIIETSTPDTESERKTKSEEIPNFENWRNKLIEKNIYNGNKK